METLNIQVTKTASSKGILWTGRIIYVLCILFLLMDAIMKIFMAGPSVEGSAALGWPAGNIQSLGFILLIPTVLYIIPRTSVLGALLLTAYLGGATSIMVRVGQPFFFPIVFGVLVWVPLFIRHEKLRALLPLTKG